jgi:hypothetical protein
MSRIPFSGLPDTARLWIFPADRPLAPPEAEALEQAVEEGLAGWAAHGSPVTWGYELVDRQFLLIGVDESTTALSGCSIDGAVHRMQDLESRLGVSLLDSDRIFFREGPDLRVLPRADFRQRVQSGGVTAETPVLDPVLTRVGDWRQGRFELPFAESWHARAFPPSR